MLLWFLPTTLCTFSTLLTRGRQIPLVESKDEASMDVLVAYSPESRASSKFKKTQKSR